jgi:hypothetical protein
MTIYPTPRPEGVKKLQKIYCTKHNMEISEEKAYEILSGIMRFLWLTEVNPPQETEESIAREKQRQERERADYYKRKTVRAKKKESRRPGVERKFHHITQLEELSQVPASVSQENTR